MESKYLIVEKDELPFKENFEELNLGNLQELREHSLFSSFSQFSKGLSISWVGLNGEDELKPHSHNVDSLILFYENNALETQSNLSIKEGQILYIPKNLPHGFKSFSQPFKAIAFQPIESSLFKSGITTLNPSKNQFGEFEIFEMQDFKMALDQREIFIHIQQKNEKFSGIVLNTKNMEKIYLGNEIPLEKGETYLLCPSI